MSSTSETITTFLPYLRRYARALTGSQEEGDRCVRLCLEELLSDPHRLGDQRFDERMALFGEFHRVWRRMNDEASREAARSEARSEENTYETQSRMRSTSAV